MSNQVANALCHDEPELFVLDTNEQVIYDLHHKDSSLYQLFYGSGSKAKYATKHTKPSKVIRVDNVLLFDPSTGPLKRVLKALKAHTKGGAIVVSRGSPFLHVPCIGSANDQVSTHYTLFVFVHDTNFFSP